MESTRRVFPGAGAGGLRRAATTVGAALVLTAAGAVPGGPGVPEAAAQRVESECRCVDEEGDPIERCTCFRAPSLDRAFALAWSGEERARIGVSVGPDQHGPDEERGVRLQRVVQGSPADEAGLRAGDLVTRVGGRSVLEPLEDPGEEEDLDHGRSLPVQRFVALVGDLEPGEEVGIEYVRDGETRRATVVPEQGWGFAGAGDLPTVRFFRGEGPHVKGHFDFEHGDGVWNLEGEGDGVRLMARRLDPCFTSPGRGGLVVVGGGRCVDGLHLQALNPQLAEYFAVDRGVLVTEVEEEAALALRAGDVIVAIDGREVEQPSDVRRILGSYEEDEEVSVTVVRRGARTEVRGTRR